LAPEIAQCHGPAFEGGSRGIKKYTKSCKYVEKNLKHLSAVVGSEILPILSKPQQILFSYVMGSYQN
jgi:hypothetical protein